jgi:hypothetical protein
MDGAEPTATEAQEEEQPWVSENLLGDDSDNSLFKAYPLRSRR